MFLLTKLLTGFFLGILLAPGIARAGAGPDAHWEDAERSVRIIRDRAEPGREAVDRLVSLHQKKCGESASAVCRLNECEAFPGSTCRKDRALFFRGEDQAFDLASTSALYRAHRNGSHYTGSLGAEALMVRFVKSLGVLRYFEYGPQAEPVLLKRSSSGKSEWVWRSGEEPVRPYDDLRAPKPAAFTAYSFHVEASYLYFREPDGRDTGIDPLISFSSDPTVARSFATPDEGSRGPGRVIVISVPVRELRSLCKTDPRLDPGTMLDTSACLEDAGNEHSEEAEVDAVLYPKSDWIFRSYLW
jgi:hypothetical protein